MPWLNSGGTRPGGLNLSGGTSTGRSSGGTSSLRPPKSALERFNLNDTFDNLSGSAVGLFGEAGRLPSRIMESPVSLVDTALQRSTGFSPVRAVKDTPLGAAGAFAGEAIKRSGNLIPALINSQDLTVWKAVGDLPDWTPITDSLVEERLGISGVEGFVRDFNENTGGVPILGAIFGLGTRPKTVGEFRQELAKRGMFMDEQTGEALDPTQLARELRSGRRSTTDFGFAAVNDNALVDFATRMALDPSNALFFVPGVGIAKAAATGGRLLAKVMPAARLAEAGVIAGKAAPIAARSAEAIMAGDRSAATLRGLGRVMKGYRTLALGTAVGNFGLNRLSAVANDATGDSIPFLREIEDFTSAVENNQPMSGNAAFMLLGAATFPYGEAIVQPIKRGARAVRMATVGLDDLAAIRREFGGTDKMHEALGGPEGTQALADFLDVQIARDAYGTTPELTQYASMTDLAMRRRMEQKALGRIVDRMRQRGEITSDMRLAKFRDWHGEQAGFADKGVKNPWDPGRAGRRWREWMQVRSKIKPLLDDTGEAIWGLRDDVIFTEQLDAGRSSLSAAVYKDASGKARVPKQAILDFIEDNPNVNALDKYGSWTKWADEAAEDPTWDAVRAKITGQKRNAVKTSDYFAEAKLWEDSAPADPTVPNGPLAAETRAERIARLRSELDEVQSPVAPKVLSGRKPDSIDRLQGTGTMPSLAELAPFATPGEHVYHLTPAANLDSIRQSGLTPGKVRPGEVNGVFFGAEAADLVGLVPQRNAGDAVLLRLRRDTAELEVTDIYDGKFDGELVSRNAVPPSALEYLGEDGAWHSVSTDTLDPTVAARHQAIQRELEDTLAAANDVRWARDKSIDPEAARAVADTLGEVDERLTPSFVFPGLRGADRATIQRVIDLEREVAQINPSYRIKSIGPKQVLADIPENGAIATALRQHRALGEWLTETSPFSTFAKFMHALTRPVMRDELKSGARQALMNDLIPRGFSPNQVNAVLRGLEARVAESVFVDKGSFRASLFRDIGSLLPGQVNRIARRVLVDEAPNPGSAAKAAKLLDAMEKDGGFYRSLSRTGSRYWRSIHAKARKGDKAAAALESVYRTWNDAPILKDVATGQRVLAKTIYPIMRFLTDPRWLALNMVEGGILSFAKDGYIRAYSEMSQASRAGRFFNANMDPEVLASFAPDIGATLTNRNLQLIALKSFDKRSAKGIGKILDELGESDPALAGLRRNMAREAIDLEVAAKKATDPAEAAALRAKAKKLREQSTGSMAGHLNDMLYRFEKDGPEATTRSAFDELLEADELAAMQPLIERVVDLNRQTWNDVQTMIHGNPNRSTLERVANSYWLYWPLSYQVKATKWLADIMLNGSFGHNNGALLAGKYALWKEQHEERLRKNPAYAALYASNPELWFAAQMILPVGPEDIGISMGRASRLIGQRAQGFANSWFKTDIGLFTLNMENERAIPWLTEMGPVYTAELFNRLYSEAEEQGFFAPDVPPSAVPSGR